MIGSTRNVRVWAAPQPTDLRKGYDGLFGLVSGALGRDPATTDTTGRNDPDFEGQSAATTDTTGRDDPDFEGHEAGGDAHHTMLTDGILQGVLRARARLAPTPKAVVLWHPGAMRVRSGAVGMNRIVGMGVVALLGWGCPAEPDVRLDVLLLTDYRPGVDFVEARVELVEESSTTREVSTDESFLDTPARDLARLEGLRPAQRRRLRVELVKPDGAVLQTSRTVSFSHRLDRQQLTRICAACEDFACPMGQTCECGREPVCVPDECEEEECAPTDGCTTDVDCRTGESSCVDDVCREGTCLRIPDDTRCVADEVCNLVESRCVPALDDTVCDELVGTLLCESFEADPQLGQLEFTPPNSVVTDGSRVYRGRRALHSRTEQADVAAWNTGYVLGGVASGDLYARFYSYTSTGVPDASFASLHLLGDDATGIVVGFDGTEVNVYSSDVEVWDTNPMVWPIDRWICVQVHIVVSDTAGRVEWWIDDVPAGQLDNLDTLPGSGYYNVHTGHFGRGPSDDPIDVWTDELVISTVEVPCDT